MELLGQLFGSQARVKLMRLFLFHEGAFFHFDELTERTLIRKDVARKELKLLEKVGFVKKGIISLKEKKVRKNGSISLRTRKVKAWKLNTRFELKLPLKTLLIETQLIKEKDILSSVRKAGKLKLLVLSGVFLGLEDGEVDMLIVIDSSDKKKLEKSVKRMESEIGRELLYAVFSTEEFQYRLDMYDKLVRNVLEGEKKILFQHNDIRWN